MKIDSKTKKRELLKNTPQRKWDMVSVYKSILIVPANTKHDSGYMQIAIVGIKENGDAEICAYPDDINWDFSNLEQKYPCAGMRTDCYYPSGILRFWGNEIEFEVGNALSSTNIIVRNKNN